MSWTEEAVRAARRLIVFSALVTLAYLLFVPAPRMPIGTANGVFVSPCCAALSLRDGHGSSRDVQFDYDIQRGKTGPLILLDHQNLVVDRGALHVVSSKGEFLFVAAERVPSWIEIDGVKFVRQ